MNRKHDELTSEEIEAQSGAPLPDKEAMSLITIGDVVVAVGDITLDVDAPITADLDVYAPIDADVGVYAPIDVDVYAPIDADVVAGIAVDLAADINADVSAPLDSVVPDDGGLTVPEVGLPDIDVPAMDDLAPLAQQLSPPADAAG